jgi:two-component system chemotaxis response regulator CheB
MKPSQHVPVVALVCSTGGLDAISRVLARLPRGFPAAVIVLQHHSPDTRSELAAILQARSVLPVAAARDTDWLVPGSVLVAPSGYHTLVTSDGMIALIRSGERPPYRPSADLLLTTLAMAAGPRAIAVVLSGHGNDGATGATAVHRFGGVVVASDEATSTIFSMPHATISRDEVIDHVVGLDDVAALLEALVAAATVGPLAE